MVNAKKEIIPIYTEKQNADLTTVEADGIYSYHWALRG
jgi:hypothetical protein